MRKLPVNGSLNKKQNQGTIFSHVFDVSARALKLNEKMVGRLAGYISYVNGKAF